MSYRLVAYETADADIAEAYDWYEQKKKGLGDDFLLSLAECCKRIFDFPFAHFHLPRSITNFSFVCYENFNSKG